MTQFLKLGLYNEINLSVRFQGYFSHVWNIPILLHFEKIRLLATLIQAGFCRKASWVIARLAGKPTGLLRKLL